MAGSNGLPIFIPQSWDGANWIEQEHFTDADAASGDQFGSSVGLSGEMILIGSPNADVDGSNTGAVYFY